MCLKLYQKHQRRKKTYKRLADQYRYCSKIIKKRMDVYCIIGQKIVSIENYRLNGCDLIVDTNWQECYLSIISVKKIY